MTKKERSWQKTENLILSESLGKLEEAEKQIDARNQGFMYRFPWEKDIPLHGEKSRLQQICDSSDSGEEEEPEIYTAYNPAKEILSNDSYFDNMNAESKRAAMQYLNTVKEVVPKNYNVTRHKYPGLFKYAEPAKTKQKLERENITKDVIL